MIHEKYKEEKFEEMYTYYPALVEAAIEFQLYSKRLVAEEEGQKSYRIKPDDEKVELSKQFNLQKDPDSGFIYCL